MQKRLLLFISLSAAIGTFEARAGKPGPPDRKQKELSVAAKVDSLNRRARDIAYVNPAKGAELSYQALELSQQADYTRGVAYALRGIASTMLTGERLYLSMKNLQRAMQLFESLGDSAGIADCYISFGHLYRRLEDRDKERYYHGKAFDFFNRRGDAERVGVTTHNLGETYYYRGDYRQATALTERAIAINDSLKNLTVLSSCYKVMGNIAMALRDPLLATKWYNKTLDISRKLGEGSQKIATIDVLMHLSDLAQRRGQNQQSLAFLEEALSIVKGNKLYNYVVPIYEELVGVCIKNHDLKRLNSIVADYNQTSYELNKVKDEAMFRFSETLFKLDSLEKYNSELREKTAVQDVLLQEKNSRSRLIALFLIVLLVLVFFLAYNIVQLKRSNRSLVEQRTTIREQNQQLRELNTLKNKFLSILSHDIKAPLQGLKSYIMLLRSGTEQISKGQLIEFSKELEQQLENTNKMADNLIAWAKLQMNSAVTRAVFLQAQQEIGQVVQLYDPIARQKQVNLEFNCTGSPTLWADQQQLTFILRNLIGNAVKYSYPGQSVVIRAQQANDRCQISVTDKGDGISDVVLQKIRSNDPLVTVPGTVGETGSGLGIRICLEFAQLNDGSITIERPAHGGTMFTLDLPALSKA